MIIFIGGWLLIVILFWILVLVHKQAKRVKELEFQIKAKDATREIKETK
jgi:hypothetical protein